MSNLPGQSSAKESFVLSALNLQPARVTDSAALPALTVARNTILEPAGLDERELSRALGTVMGSAVDYADLYFQVSREESWALEDGIVKEGAHSIEQGVGVRALAGEKTGFAYSDEIVLPALAEASKAARAIARTQGSGSVAAW
jgi:TldD protein